MDNHSLSRDVALRVGLAARILPGVNAAELLSVLVERVGLPLTEKKLAGITVTDLRSALNSVDGEEDTEDTAVDKSYLKQAVRYLWGVEQEEPDRPDIQAYAEGEMPGSVRVAVASTDNELIDGHFGSCPHYLIYQVSCDEIRLIDKRSAAAADDAEDKNAFRAALVKDCQVLYVQSIGGPAAAKVVRAGLHPMKIPEGGKALDSLAQLQQILAGSPPPWLAKAIGLPAEERRRYGTDEE
jgi:nitrogen fixation protein NifX